TRVVAREVEESRLSDSVETALRMGAGVVLVASVGGEEVLFSEHFACVQCGISLGEIAPRTFSFNSPHGACPACTGLGNKLEVDPELLLPNKALSLSEGAIQSWVWNNSWGSNQLEDVARQHGFSTEVPVSELSEDNLRMVFYGEDGHMVKYRNRYGRVRAHFTGFEGVVPYLERRYKETNSDLVRGEIEKHMSSHPCTRCQGKRLRPEALAVTVESRNIMEVTALPVNEALEWVNHLESSDVLSSREQIIARQVLKEIRSRLGFLHDVGLEYLTLDRSSTTLAGGEAQRIRLATQIGSGLMGVLYICDEPTVGLHPADGYRLIETLKRLRDLGNTIIVVEHDEAVMRAAGLIIDMGPGAGERGGEVVVVGTMEEVKRAPQSITGQYLSGAKKIPIPRRRRKGNGPCLTVLGARQNNLKGFNVRIPLGKLVGVTGVSGSGKSTLVNDILYNKLAQTLYRSRERPGECDGLEGVEHIDKVVGIDQSAIGRTPRSNPATYTGTFTPIREVFASLPEARVRGYTPGRFSFNVRGGRCEACHGEGYIQIEMHFLPDVTVSCEVCGGKRYNREALEVYFKGRSIADVLDMTVEEALGFFSAQPKIRSKLETLRDVGLGYIRLGQPATTLSGGEAQRVKLSTELSRRATGNTLYILDEPTTGLSFSDVAALLQVLHRLVDGGNTVVVIEHHLDVIKNADWLIDLGPGAGDRGGYVVAQGTPERVAEVGSSSTGQYIKKLLARDLGQPVPASGN
ncbi:MAG: excinuclease ABC subunit UvrA, partial [Dehalococcoidia bacterium]|nr:excinuclease ABC subunit UvrA [Dehalococcoidia bacterium]